MKIESLEAAALCSSRSWGAGDKLDLLYRRYRDEVHRYVLRVFGAGPPDPDDVVQAVFVRFAERDGGEQIDNPQAFLVRSARNYVLDDRRRRQVRTAYSVDMQATADRADELDAARVLDAKQRLATLEIAVASLDPRMREMLIANRIHGLSCAEIARQYSCSATQVKTLIARALLRCQRALEGEST